MSPIIIHERVAPFVGLRFCCHFLFCFIFSILSRRVLQVVFSIEWEVVWAGIDCCCLLSYSSVAQYYSTVQQLALLYPIGLI